MADVAKINDGNNIKRTGGVYATGASSATTDDRVYDTITTASGAGAQNAGGNATPAPPFAVVASGCIGGYGTNTSPIYIEIDPSGGLACTDLGLCVDVTQSFSNTSGCLDGDGTAGDPLVLIVDPSGGLSCGEAGLKTAIVTDTCIDGSGTNANPLTLVLDPSGGLACGVNGLRASGVSVDDYFVGETDNGNSGAAISLPFNLKANQKVTLTDNAALTLTAPASARSTKIHFVQGGAGNYTPTASGLSGTIPSLASGVGESTIVNLYFDGAGVWHV